MLQLQNFLPPAVLVGLLLFSTLDASRAVFGQTGPGQPSELRCEYLSNPLGIDVRQPRFSWVLEHARRDEIQTAYQVLVSTRSDLLGQDKGDQWDSGRVASDDQTQVVYHGKPLESGHRHYWKVRYWDKEGNPSPYSRPASFEMGLLSRQEWGGHWISGGGQLRKEFTLQRRVVRARAYVTALGYYELRLNGEKIGANVLDPAWTTYPKRVLYTTYDITGLLQSGANAVGIMLGGGWATQAIDSRHLPGYYPSPAVLLQMNIELEAGTRVRVVSDGSWKTARGPILSDSVYDGERYDARLETPGWDRLGFDDSGWKEALAVEGSSGALSAQMMPPIRVVDTMVPRAMTNPRGGVYVYDMGQNISGWALLRVSGPRGTRVNLRFAEVLYDDGTINRDNLRKAQAQETYILRGEGEEVYEPRFTYHGFRYVELIGYPGTPDLDSLRGRLVHTAVEPAGSFAASKSILNDIQRIIRWSQITNLHSIPTDCPQRDERQGWLDDTNVTAEEAVLNFDLAAFYTNFIRDIRDIQDPDGTITDTVPFKYGKRPADPNAGAAFPTVCWLMYEQYGDRRILEENYEALKKWVEFLHNRTPDYIVRYSYYGDWVALESTPEEYISSVYYDYTVRLFTKIARALGKSGDAQTYTDLESHIREAINKTFFDAGRGTYANGTQTANAMALFLDLVPEEHRARVLGRLTDDIVYHHDTHLTTGIQGVRFLFPVLTSAGRTDLAYELATQTTFPSWGYMVAHGATTQWELWENKTGPGMNSHNHPMFGYVGAWFYEALAGINQGPEGAGYRHIRIAPQIVRDLNGVSATVRSVHGRVSSSWTHLPGTITLEVTIPVNSDAEIVIPKTDEMRGVQVWEGDHMVLENGRYVSGDSGMSGASETENTVVLKIGSGTYALRLTGQ